jgi:hypothetical protein
MIVLTRTFKVLPLLRTTFDSQCELVFTCVSSLRTAPRSPPGAGRANSPLRLHLCRRLRLRGE